jgi:hypothetical protein
VPESVHDIVEVGDIGGNRQVVPAIVGHFMYARVSVCLNPSSNSEVIPI